MVVAFPLAEVPKLQPTMEDRGLSVELLSPIELISSKGWRRYLVGEDVELLARLIPSCGDDHVCFTVHAKSDAQGETVKSLLIEYGGRDVTWQLWNKSIQP